MSGLGLVCASVRVMPIIAYQHVGLNLLVANVCMLVLTCLMQMSFLHL